MGLLLCVCARSFVDALIRNFDFSSTIFVSSDFYLFIFCSIFSLRSDAMLFHSHLTWHVYIAYLCLVFDEYSLVWGRNVPCFMRWWRGSKGAFSLLALFRIVWVPCYCTQNVITNNFDCFSFVLRDRCIWPWCLGACVAMFIGIDIAVVVLDVCVCVIILLSLPLSLSLKLYYFSFPFPNELEPN